MSTICQFVNKEGKACVEKVLGTHPLTVTSEAAGVPFRTVKDNTGKPCRITGSANFCNGHQIHEQWWPRCSYCKNGKVSIRARGNTAWMCDYCIKRGVHIKAPFSDPVLEVAREAPSPNGPWAKVVHKNNKYIPKPTAITTKEEPVSAAVAAARSALETARKAQQEAEAEVARVIRSEKDRLTAIEREKQRVKDNRVEIANFVALATPVQLDVLVSVIRNIAPLEMDELVELVDYIRLYSGSS